MSDIQTNAQGNERGAAFFRCIAEQACDAILGIHIDGRICYANRHAAKMYGYTWEELCDMHIRTLRAPEALADFEELFRRASGDGVMFRTIHRCKDGRAFPVEVNSRGVDLPEGRIVVSIIRDNTVNAQLTQELQAARMISDCLLRAANVLVMIFDCAGQIRFLNETAQQVTGYTSGEVQGRDGIALLAPPDHEALARSYFQACLCSDHVGLAGGPIVTKAGVHRNISWQTFALEGPGGMEGILWLGVDATERLRAEESLQRKETFIHGVVEGLMFPFFVVDRQYRYLVFNAIHKKGVKDLFNADIELGMDVLSYHRNLRNQSIAKANFDQALSGEPCIFEGVIGEETYKNRLVLIEHNPVRNFMGDIMGVAVVVHDISQLRQAEAETRAMQLQYKGLVEDVPAIMMVVSTEGKIQYINPFGAQLFQFSAEELAGRPAAETILPEMESTGRKLWDFYRDLWAEPFREYHHTNENVTKRGRRLWVSWSIRGGDCPVTEGQHWLCMGMDVTEKHRAMEREKHKQERKRQNEIMQDILSGRIPQKKTAEHLRKLGLELQQPMICFAVQIPRVFDSEGDLSQRQETETILDCCRLHSGGIVWEASGCVGVLMPSVDAPHNTTVLTNEAKKVWRNLRQCVSDGMELAGMAFKTDDEPSVVQLFFQARSAMMFGPCLCPGKTLYCWRDLGWLRLLVQNVNTYESRQFVQEHLENIFRLPSDEKRKTMLVTLKKALEGKTNETIAREMNVHKQTVRYRVTVLKSMLKVDDLSGESGINIAIALRLHDMQNDVAGLSGEMTGGSDKQQNKNESLC
ncbi:MAG: PAS domain S-box protein [Negativicutes bacterium]